MDGIHRTTCAVCGHLKETPMRRDELGGYVCLTCVDKRLDQFLKPITREQKNDNKGQSASERLRDIQKKTKGHTPYPWGFNGQSIGHGDYVIAEFWGRVHRGNEDEVNANVKLVAVAPEILTIAIELADELQRAFGTLAMYGVPKTRGVTVSNGIDVLATRYRKDITLTEESMQSKIDSLKSDLTEREALLYDMMQWPSNQAEYQNRYQALKAKQAKGEVER